MRKPIELPTWLTHSSKALFFTVIGLISIALVVLGVRIAREWNARNWYGKEPYRALVVHAKSADTVSSVSILTVWPTTNKVTIFKINPDVTINAAGGYGNYRLGALLKLGEIEHVGVKLLSDSIGAAFGIPIHTVMVSSNQNISVSEIQRYKLWNALKAKESLTEALDVWSLLHKVVINAAESIELNQTNVVRSRMEIDNSQIQYLDPSLLDAFMQAKTVGDWKEAASVQIAVINSSGKSGMASQWSRYFRYSGFDVVSVTDQPETQGETKIIVADSSENNLPLRVIRKIMPWAKVEGGQPDKYRAAVAVILGTDSWSWLNDRVFYLKN